MISGHVARAKHFVLGDVFWRCRPLFRRRVVTLFYGPALRPNARTQQLEDMGVRKNLNALAPFGRGGVLRYP